ncbi:MAG: UDP-N-acetylglucosamine--N-acetylmuramyl-(pentapeptide) pyrophosphoryl-undecaprenol N-acetylglucosamine transferase [Planctomycetota bacterium]
MRVLFAGGGTGGHLMPGAATAGALRRLLPGARCLFLTTDRRAEKRCRGAIAGFETAQVPDAPLHGARSKALFPGRALWATQRALGLMGEFRPHVVVGLGSYNCAVPILLARWLGTPTAVLEANVVPGRTVRALAPVVDRVFVHWGQALARMKPRCAVVSGLPLRARLFGVDRGKAARRLGLRPDRLTLLAMGGSQGSVALNRALLGALRRIYRREVELQVIHLTGVNHLWEALQTGLNERACYRPIGFLERIEDAYAAADFALSRAGSAVAELTALGLPSVLVPYPHAADDHQTANARRLAEAGAAITIPESELTGRRLAEALSKLATDRDLRRRMGESARSQGRSRAALTVAARLAELAGFERRIRRDVLREAHISEKNAEAA